jgi:N-sulfoglucosamine sulfohydrolase
MKILLILTILWIPGFLLSQNSPNILWITAEDMSPVLRCYGDTDAITPNIDKLALESIKFTNAFSSSPVCSPSRSCLIQGALPPSMGTQHMRSGFPLPSSFTGFPSLLRKDGYYTTNNVKTDYNSGNYQQIIEKSWNESSSTAHWRKREKKDMPFFCVFNLMTSHQSRSMVWSHEKFQNEIQSKLSKNQIHNPQKIKLPPYYPDTPIVRKTVARFHDCVTAMDHEVGEILKQLQEDGLAENTIVFFFSDHGSGMPRHKRALLDSGMHVPLLVRLPKKWQHFAQVKPGQTTDRLVSFVDFGPTMLNLAGTSIPSHMQGRPFLGKNTETKRKYVYGHRDRVDEVRDFARSVRDKKYLYIRNYMPHLGYNQPTAWPDIGEIRHEFYKLAKSGKMNPAQSHFAGPRRPIEELYDCENDPLNLTNLANSPKHLKILKKMRSEHLRYSLEIRDWGYIPEYEAWEMSKGSSGWMVGKASKVTWGKIIDAAELVGRAKESKFVTNLKSENETIRYWATIGLGAYEKKLSGDSLSALEKALKDSSPSVRIEAANALIRNGNTDSAIAVLIEELEHKNLIVVAHAARTIELLGEKAKKALPAMKACLKQAYTVRPPDLSPVIVLPGDQDMAMFVGFSCNAFLQKVK